MPLIHSILRAVIVRSGNLSILPSLLLLPYPSPAIVQYIHIYRPYPDLLSTVPIWEEGKTDKDHHQTYTDVVCMSVDSNDDDDVDGQTCHELSCRKLYCTEVVIHSVQYGVYHVRNACVRPYGVPAVIVPVCQYVFCLSPLARFLDRISSAVLGSLASVSRPRCNGGSILRGLYTCFLLA